MKINSVHYFPQFILNNPDVLELLDAEQNELNRFGDYVELMRDQMFISTSNLYLNRYEKAFGIANDDGLNDQERIGRVLAKLNTRTNSTKDAIKAVVTSITKCDTDIEEHFNDYTFTIDVLRSNEQIINIESIKEAVEIIKPAHLAFQVQMCFLLTIGINVSTLVYHIAHDVCSDAGVDFDYAGETPDISLLGKIDNALITIESNDKAYPILYELTGVFPSLSTIGAINTSEINLNADDDAYSFDYDMSSFEAGILPHTSTLGAINSENGQIQAKTETFTTTLDFAQNSDDFCGEDS